METLLIVLVIGCALAFVVQVGRGIWARARTVERHQQALDTLAGLTQRPDGTDDTFGGLAEHQAHVRLISPGGQVAAGETSALPPPRAVPSSPSAFGRAARTAPAPAAIQPPAAAIEPPTAAIEPPTAAIEPPTAAIEAVVVSASLAPSETARLVPASPPPPPVRSGPTPEPAHETMPGLPPPPALPAENGVFVEPPTVPVPIVQPQVFYFDDLSSRGETREDAAQKPRRLGRRRRRSSDTTAEHLLPALPPPPVFPGNERTTDGSAESTGNRGGHKSFVGLALAAAAICVAVVAIGVTVLGLPGQGSPSGQIAARSGPPSSAAHSPTTTGGPKVTTTTPPAAKPAVLVSSQNGTATYQLSSASASIVVSASGPCWLEVRANSPLGQIVYEGTLEAGVRFSVTGPAWIRLGNPPVVAVKVNGTPMTVPGGETAVPLNLQFTFG
jgi:hypothetical protein